MEESESKKSKVSQEVNRKRKNDTDHRDLDIERSQRDDSAQASSSGQKRPAEDPRDDSERGERLGFLGEAGTRAPAEPRFLSLNLLNRIYAEDGQGYDHDDYEPVLNARKKFGDLPSVAEVYSPPHVAAQAMTVGLRPGFSIDTGTLKPDGTSWDQGSDLEYNIVQA